MHFYYSILCLSTITIVSANRLYDDGVTVEFFYESLCPYCIKHMPVIEEVIGKLGKDINWSIHPYGNANTTEYSDGRVEVSCQHGKPECYGNKLHACAIELLRNGNESLVFNSCLMRYDSDDNAANKCGEELAVSVEKVDEIKECANGSRGHNLHVMHGKITEKESIDYVPYVLLNGEEFTGSRDSLMKAVCDAFTATPPAACETEAK